MQRRPVQQLQAATPEQADVAEPVAMSLPDEREMVATADVAVQAAPEAVATRLDPIPMARQAATPGSEALAELVERQP